MPADVICASEPLTQRLRIDRTSGRSAVTSRVSSHGSALTMLAVYAATGEIEYQQELGDLLGAAVAWSPVQSALAYVADTADGTAQVHLLCFDGGEVESSPLTALPFGVVDSDLDWAPDGQSVLVVGRTVERRGADVPFRATRRIWRYEGLGVVDANLTDVCRVNLDGEVTWLELSTTGIVSQPRWSPAGTSISYLVAFEQVSTATPCPSLRVWSPQTESPAELLSTDWGWITTTRWLPDAESILVLGARHEASGGLFAAQQSLWTVGVDHAPRDITSWLPGGAGSQMQSDVAISWPTAASNVELLADGRTAVFTAESAGRTYVTDVDLLTGESSGRVVAADTASYALLDITEGEDGTELFVLESAIDLPPRVVRVGADSEWTHSPRDGLESREMNVRHYAIPSADGLTIDTWVVLPSGRAPFPAVLKVHGGPYGSIGEIYGEDTEVLVRAGCAVVLHNFRGSYGYGTAFARRISANWGELGERDHHAVLDFLIADGLVDAARVGVMGHSHGAFAACWLVSRSDRFAAAVAEDPAANFHDSVRTSDVGPWIFKAEFGLALDDAAGFLARSPITYAHQCTTPLLLIQGERDVRCPPNQSDQMYAALWDAGCPVEMLRLPSADHMGSVFGSHGYRRVRIEAVRDWFVRHLVTLSTTPVSGEVLTS